MADIANIPFEKVTSALLDDEQILDPRYLYRLSDLEGKELAAFAEIWPDISVRRRKALLEDLWALTETDYLLSFEALSRIAVRDADPDVRIPALQILWEFDPIDLIPWLLDQCIEDPDLRVRECTVVGLGKFVYMGELDEIPSRLQNEIENRLLQLVTGNDDRPVRLRALEALGYSGREEINELIEEAAARPDTKWLASALLAMGRSANKAWKPFVLSHLDHTKPIVRQEAARAAGELALKEAKPGLLELTRDFDDQVRAAAAWALSELGGPGVRKRIEALLAEALDEEEAAFFNSVLDNLSFTEDYAAFDLLEDDGDDLSDLYEEQPGDREQAG